LDIRTTILARAGGADLDRLVVARHSGLRESGAAGVAAVLPDWVLQHEVSFAIYGERGVIDILAWHAGRRALLIIELKTDVVDVDDLLATMDRRRRLARRIALDRGWDPSTVSVWVVVAAGRTTRRRLARFRTVLRTAFPLDGRSMTTWLRAPSGSVAALSLWHRIGEDAPSDGLAARHRVRARRVAA
jgi:hypothetical protein